MRKIKITLVALLISIASFADEGMWLPMFLQKMNYAEMKGMGLELTPEQIYSINNSSIKDAIVRMGGGFCTGEIISPEGLLLTNHHCGYDYIQQHSTVENNLLANGFWAKTKKDELPNEGLYVEFLVRMKDVTEEVLAKVNAGLPGQERQKRISAAIDAIIEREKGDTDYNVAVKPFYGGNEYYMFVYETYYDVRLVGAPPESIGKFGGDTDNWMWPRHTGDFSLFRVYTGPDGKPAPYSPDNIPLKPRHYLPISLDGVKEGDFAMIFGYPGSTNRYLTSYGVKLAIEESNPTRVDIRDKRLEILKEDMDASKEVRLKYASKYAQVSNYWKYFIGQTQGLKKLDVYGKKKQQEKAFLQWVNSDPQRKEAYGNTIETIKKGYDKLRQFNKASIYGYEAGFGPEITLFGYQFAKLPMLLSQPDSTGEAVKQEIAKLKDVVQEHFENYNAPTDKKVFAALMKMYYENIDPQFHPGFFQAVADTDLPDSAKIFPGFTPENEGDFKSLAEFIWTNSILTDRDKLNNYMADPSVDILTEDPGFRMTMSMLNAYRNIMQQRFRVMDEIDAGNRLYIKGLREMYPDKKFYPDANSTLRFTYGQVLSYEPKDGIKYKYTTTLKGVMEKEDPSNPEFIVPDRLKKLYKAKDYGAYGENGELVVGFLTNTDITGGNSGSPVINAEGQLIGVAFDGNWEAMSGDIAFEPELQRTISVDIRYILFVIDKFAGAGHLVDEMTLVDDGKKEKKRRRRN